MIIKHVHLRNIGPHRDCQVEMSTGTVVITGHNGAGKSTFVNSIYAALTNDFDRFNVTKAKIISNDCGDEPSFIKVVGEHRDREFTIIRSLRPNSSKLTIGDGKPETNATRINAMIETELGVSRQIIDTYIFVAQWSMFGFLDHTPAKRAEAFQHLCGTTSATVIHATCNEFISTNAVTMVTDNSLELTAQMAELEGDIKKYEAELATYEADVLTMHHQTEFAKIVADFDMAVSNKPSLDNVQKRMQQTMETIARLKAEKERLGTLIDGYEDKMTRAPAAKAAAEAVRTKRNNFTAWSRRKLDRESALANANKLLVPPEVDMTGVPTEDEYKAAMTLETQLVFQLDMAANFLAAIEAMPAGQEISCPECQQVVADDYVTQRREAAAALQLAVEAPRATIRAYNSYVAKKKAYDDAVAKRKLNITLATRSLAECEKEVVQDVTEQELLKANNMLQNIEKLQADLQTAKTNLKTTESQLAAAQRSLASDATEQQRLKDIVETNCPSQDEYDGAKAALQAHTAVYEAHTTAKVTLGVRQESLVTAKKALADLEAALIRQERQHNVLSTLYRAAQVFHWNELPKKVAQANLRAIVRDVNENLVLFESPFTVEADDSLTFIVNFPGRAPVEAVQLSGGQKVVLAVAFRTALGRVFGNDVGMMFMDEPTAGLDADNIGYFHEALQRFASKMATKSQLVVVTHVDGLGHAADQRIEFRR